VEVICGRVILKKDDWDPREGRIMTPGGTEERGREGLGKKTEPTPILRLQKRIHKRNKDADLCAGGGEGSSSNQLVGGGILVV